jgi:ribosomal-protein-alanine N-acetyltransferase
MPLTVLHGDRIRLRQLRKSDAVSIQENINNRKICQNLPLVPYPYTLNDALEWIRTTHSLSRKGAGYNFGIEDKQIRKVVGCIGLKNINRPDKNAEVGYWLSERLWGRGYMTEAVGLILGYLFKDLRLRRVYAIVNAANIGSIRVLEKNGFIREGTFRKACLLNRRWTDVYAYGLLKEEYKG